jgi:valyl-tRNA synthetase
VLGTILGLLHPFMPYITEALWAEMGNGRDRVLALTRWPEPRFTDEDAAADINWLVELVTAVRSVRNEMHVPNGARIALTVLGGGTDLDGRMTRHRTAIERLARIEGIEAADKAPQGSAQIVAGGATYALQLAGVVDFAAEEARLEKEVTRVNGEIARIDKKLANASFVARAPEEVVDAEREKRATYAADGERLSAALKRVKDSVAATNGAAL